MSLARIHCAVPFCKRTADPAKMPGATEMICRTHGRAVPERLRKLYRKQLRLEFGPGELTGLTNKQIRRGERLWQRFKQAAISAAGVI
jgi:hypothetical protein